MNGEYQGLRTCLNARESYVLQNAAPRMIWARGGYLANKFVTSVLFLQYWGFPREIESRKNVEKGKKAVVKSGLGK